jgi:hypothetical protein
MAVPVQSRETDRAAAHQEVDEGEVIKQPCTRIGTLYKARARPSVV